MNEPVPFSIDSVLTPEGFAKWLGVSEDWVRERWNTLPGTITESREVKRIYLRAYVEARTNKQRR